jgi:lipoprotein NlpI
VVLVVPLAIAILQFPSALTAGIAFERGQRADANGAFDLAVVEYSKVVERFPTSTLAVARKGIAAFHARQYQVAAEAFNIIAGRDASPEIVREVNNAIDEMKKVAR